MTIEEYERREREKAHDRFAGYALMGMIASSPITDRTDPVKVNKPSWAKQAFEFADAMMNERSRRK